MDQTWLTVMLNGFPWKQTEIILSFLRLHLSTAFQVLFLTMRATPFLLRDFCPRTAAYRLLCPWIVAPQAPLSMRFPGKNTGVGCHFLLQGVFPTQRSNPRLLYWQVCSLPVSYLGSPHREYSLSKSYVAPMLGHRVSTAIEM